MYGLKCLQPTYTTLLMNELLWVDKFADEQNCHILKANCTTLFNCLHSQPMLKRTQNCIHLISLYSAWQMQPETKPCHANNYRGHSKNTRRIMLYRLYTSINIHQPHRFIYSTVYDVCSTF